MRNCGISMQKSCPLSISLTLKVVPLRCHGGAATALQLASASEVLAAVQAGQVASLPGHHQYDGGREHEKGK